MAESTKRKRADTVTVETIKSGGDVTLLVGEDEDCVGLLVSSTWLSSTSPVFQAMLEGRFSEAVTTRSAESPQELFLPHDDPSGIRDLCAFIHHNVELINTPWSIDRILELAIAMDKYDCTSPLQLQTQALLLEYLDGNTDASDPEEAGSVLAAAWLFEDRRAFNIITQRLIQSYIGPLSLLHTSADEDELPYKVLCTYLPREKRLASLTIL